VELGASYLLFRAGPLLFESRYLGAVALPTAYNLITLQTEKSFSDLFWSPTNRTQELKQTLSVLEEQMQKRQLELLKFEHF